MFCIYSMLDDFYAQTVGTIEHKKNYTALM
jgi:hypothetical protein